MKEMKKGLEIRSRGWGWKVASEKYYSWEVSKQIGGGRPEAAAYAKA